MNVRVAQEIDAQAMGEVMVTTFLAAHRDQMPAEAWAKRAREWTPDVSAHGWTQAIQDIAAGELPYECIYVAEATESSLVGLVMGGLVDETDRPPTGVVYVLYVQETHQGCGVGRKLLHAAARDLALHNARVLRIGCLAANTPARRFYETMGGEMVGERLFDEEGVLLPEVVYEWADITLLAAGGRPEPSEAP